MSRSKILSHSGAAEAKLRRHEYEANLACEGIALNAAERAFLDSVDDQRLGFDEGVEAGKRWLQARLKNKPAAAE